ncbi:hypothetical protein NL50_14870 [Clostridium acetobutylicum]|nr:hypothetical protein NL50_14870 [Clostridium acetobutylicum]
MEYEDLLNEANIHGIDIIEMNFKGYFKGLYSDNTIAIDKNIETNKEKKCILAEELGHHFTTVGNILNQSTIDNKRQEKKARNWAFEKLVGLVSLINAFEKGIRTKSEIAEYLNITEKFFDEAIQHYREKYGLYYEVDHYAIYFEPTLSILKMY